MEDKKYKNSGYIGGVLGFIFDTSAEFAEGFSSEQIATIDDFLDSMMWDKENDQRSNELMIGDFMNVADFENRWTYKGSLTTPPCSTSIQWNVMKQVFPMKQKHLDQFKKQLARNDKYKLADFGNFREAQEIKDQEVWLISSSIETDGAIALTVFIIILVVSLIITLITTVIYYRSYKSLSAGGEAGGAPVAQGDYDTGKGALGEKENAA